MGNNFKFTYENLEKLLLHMKGIAPVIPMRDAPGAKGGFIILRHDVDLDIYPAFLMGQLEKKLEINSTFFIMTTSPYYNPLSLENRKLLCNLIEDGHEVGLHFDPTVYPNSSDQELNEKVDMESRLLESATGKTIKSISLHNPTAHGNYIQFEKYINAYSEDFFSEDKYISDSYMEKSFLNKDPFQFVMRGENKTCQVLVHPCQFTDNGKNFNGIRKDYLTRVKISFDDSFRNLIEENP